MGTKDCNVNIQLEEGDVLGATPSENLVITRIQAGTLADGHLQEGDKILKVNGTAPHDVAHFYKLVVGASRGGHLNMVVRREAKTIEAIKDSKSHVPQERLGNLRLRDGFQYHLVSMEYQRGDKIGLGIKDYMNCVVVTKAPDGTMAGRVFKVGDQICDVDGTRVTDKGVCQTLIVGALKSNQKVTMVVASAESAEAKKWVEDSLVARAPSDQPVAGSPQLPMASTTPSASAPIQLAIVSREPPSIRVKNDVRRIALAEIERRRKEPAPPLKGIIRVNNKDGKKITFSGTLQQEHLIVNENPTANLRPVK